MTKSQNTKNEQLTEQWKKGELPAGYYYVKNEFNNIFPSDYSESYDSINDAVIKDFFTEVSEITEVIAKMPSYEEYLSLTYAKEEDEGIIAEYEAENKQLKELLKECKDIMDKAGFMFAKVEDVEKAKDLIKKIDEVLK